MLEGKAAVVTGGARGIGAAIASTLRTAGADVATWDLNGADHGVDVSEANSVRAALAATVRQSGPVSVFVNNAGIDVIGPFIDSDENDWRRILDVNLIGVFNCCKAVLPSMIEHGRGTIVNLASDAGRVGSSGEAVYSATKGGVIAFSKTLAREHARQGITVNCVCPGPTNTALLDQVAAASQKLYDGLARAIPLGRIGQPADIAKVVAFLASDAAAYMTGQTLSVSGGLTMA